MSKVQHGRVGPQIGPEVLKGALVFLNHPLLIIYLTLRLWKPWPIEIDHKNHYFPFFKMVIFQFDTAQNHMGPTRSSPVFSHKCLHSAKPEHPRDDHSEANNFLSQLLEPRWRSIAEEAQFCLDALRKRASKILCLDTDIRYIYIYWLVVSTLLKILVRLGHHPNYWGK